MTGNFNENYLTSTKASDTITHVSEHVLPSQKAIIVVLIWAFICGLMIGIISVEGKSKSYLECEAQQRDSPLKYAYSITEGCIVYGVQKASE